MRLPVHLGCAAALLAGCGGNGFPESDTHGRLLRPRLYAAGDAHLPQRASRPLPLPADPSAWDIRGRNVHLADGRLVFESGESGPGDARVQVDVPGSFETTDFNQVAVTGVFPAVYSLGLGLAGEGAQPFQHEALTTRKQEAPQTLLFDLAGLRGRAIRFDRLSLVFRGPRRPFALHAIDLIHLPEHHLLPPLDGEPALVDLGQESRPAQGLPPGVRAECTFAVDHPADRLTLAAGLPLRLRPGGGRPSLAVTVTGAGGGSVQARIDLVREGGPRWQEATLSLERFAGQQVTARFVYDSSHKRPGVCALGDLRVWRPGTQPPTTLLVSSDTQRADHVAAMGLGVELDTPSLDALAREGLIFERCWATTNVTSPSHVAMLTAIHPRDTRLVNNQDRLVGEARTLAEAFREAGWRTLAVVSVRHLGPLGTNLGQGFDRIQAPTGQPWSAQVAVGTLEAFLEQAEGLPVFAFLHLFDAHHPYQPPPSHDRRYYPADRDPFDPALPAIAARQGSMPADYLGRLRDVEFPKAQYRAEVTYLDAVLGGLFARPRVAAGLIAFTADHGEILEKAGTFFNHGELYPDTLHVPLVLGGAALPAEFVRTRVPAPTSQLGLGRTLLDLSRLTHVDFPGRNLLLDAARDAADAPPLFALSAHGHSASIVWRDGYLILHLVDHQGTLAEPRARHQVELFDLAADPECLVDRAAEQPQRALELRDRLVAWLLDADARGLSARRTSSAAELSALKAMGYATEEAAPESQPWYVPE